MESVPSTPLSGKKVAFVRQHSRTSKKSLETVTSSHRSSAPSGKYGRRASVFILEHLEDFKGTGLGIGEKFNYWMYGKMRLLSRKWFTHCFLIIVMILYTVGGAVIFLTVEGQNETKLIEKDINLQVKELLDDLRQKSLSHPKEFSVGEWIGEASRELSSFEQTIKDAFRKHPLVVSHTNGRVWDIWNSVVYCSTLYTTIGYGHIYPTTFTGRVLTIIYSTIGIPLFLIALTDFGKLFTRGIKFVWSHIRRFYYTRSCRRVRRNSHVDDIFKGAQAMYEFATFRRKSLWEDSRTATDDEEAPRLQTAVISEPQTPAISSFEIDDEFNLPVTLALFILVLYILIGAAAFMVWEQWDFFPAFYFVFISMSTIGFGDIVPEKPIFMIVAIVYLCFGLALMTMCINVVQDKLSDTFNQASTKIGETIGIDVGEDEEEDEKTNGDEKGASDKEDKEEKGDEEHQVKDSLNHVDTASTIRIENSPFKWSTPKVIR